MKKKVLVPIIIGIAVLMLAVMTVLGCTVLKEPICRAVLSPEQYARHVIKENCGAVIEQLAKVYDQDLLLYSGDFQQNGKVTVCFSEETLEDLGDILDEDELDVFRNLSVDIISNVKGMLISEKISLFHEKTAIASVDLVLDMEEDILYFQSEELGAPWAYIKLKDFMESEDVEEMEECIYCMTTLKGNMPSSAQVSRLLNRYVEVLANEITDVEKTSETLDAGGVEQKFTILEMDITESLVKNMVRSFAEEIMNDEELEEYVVNFCDAYEDLESAGLPEGDEAWDEIVDEMKELKSQAREIDFNNTKCVLCLYVDSWGDIRGFRIKVDEKDYDNTVELEAIQAVRGNNYGAEIILEMQSSYSEDKVKFVATGTKSGNKVTADCKITYDGINYKFRVEDLDWSKMWEGSVSGKIYFKARFIGDGLSYVLGYSGAEMFSEMFRNAEICISLDTSCGAGSIGFSLLDDEETQVSVVFENALTKGGSVVIPSDADRLKEEEDLMEYLEDLDYDEILDTLEELGTPEIILEELFDSLI